MSPEDALQFERINISLIARANLNRWDYTRLWHLQPGTRAQGFSARTNVHLLDSTIITDWTVCHVCGNIAEDCDDGERAYVKCPHCQRIYEVAV